MSLPLDGRGEREDSVLGNFILSEIRELRRGMEGRDEQMRSEMSALKGALADLAKSLTRSEGNVGVIRTDLDKMTDDIKLLREDVDELQTRNTKTDAAWLGPRRIVGILVMMGAAAGGILALIELLPYVNPTSFPARG